MERAHLAKLLYTYTTSNDTGLLAEYEKGTTSSEKDEEMLAVATREKSSLYNYLVEDELPRLNDLNARKALWRLLTDMHATVAIETLEQILRTTEDPNSNPYYTLTVDILVARVCEALTAHYLGVAE